MKAYELLFFVDPAIEEEAREALQARIESTITGQDGVIDSVEPWGKRKLAYEINKLQDGDYTLINFRANPSSIAELDRVLRITDAVVRFMVVRKDQNK
jgi:small subunit ribosomal protein S6